MQTMPVDSDLRLSLVLFILLEEGFCFVKYISIEVVDHLSSRFRQLLKFQKLPLKIMRRACKLALKQQRHGCK